jgi:hypothetical protein
VIKTRTVEELMGQFPEPTYIAAFMMRYAARANILSSGVQSTLPGSTFAFRNQKGILQILPVPKLALVMKFALTTSATSRFRMPVTGTRYWWSLFTVRRPKNALIIYAFRRVVIHRFLAAGTAKITLTPGTIRSQ